MSSSPSSTAEYQAMVYDNKPDAEPLLKQEPSGAIDEAVFFRFKTSSLVLGLMVGFFIQFSTLGANYLALSYMGESIMSVTQRELILFSLFWSLLTSTMAILVLAFLRSLINSTYQGEDVEDIVLHMECRYVIGALIGVCTAWAATDVALGMTGQVIYSAITLVVALSWCRLMMWFFATPLKVRRTEADVEDEIMLV